MTEITNTTINSANTICHSGYIVVCQPGITDVMKSKLKYTHKREIKNKIPTTELFLFI